MTQLASDLENIKDALRAWGQPTITGAKLGELIKKSAPDLNVRQVTLRFSQTLRDKFSVAVEGDADREFRHGWHGAQRKVL
ncbi:hypothetical protein [Cupriavidus necator]|nr:hypothetical protein [Cupriavidus necator]